MVTRISSGTNPTGAVYYNENKVKKGEADRLAVRNFEGVNQPVPDLRLATIANRLEEQASLNERVSKPTFHVSLALAKGEKPPADELLCLADRYMDGMGYGRQPYVVYQHHDTDHTHIHIVTVRVDEEGHKISDKYERQRSNDLRKIIEQEFGLQVAERAALRHRPDELHPVEYGKGDLKRDISSVVQGILTDFTFSTFSQYNQLLNLYNVKATEVTVAGKKPGLVYACVNRHNVAQGATFKASSLPHQPTMETVNRRLNAGKKRKGDQVPQMRQRAAAQLVSKDWSEFQHRLSRSGIEVIPHQGKDGNLFGISFVDVRSRTIYTGSELGKPFTAGSLKAKLGERYTPALPGNVNSQDVDSDNRHTVHRLRTLDAHGGQVGPAKEMQKTQHREPVQSQSLNATDPPNQTNALDLVRQMLYALGDESAGPEQEYELKQMLKRARKPPRS